MKKCFTVLSVFTVLAQGTIQTVLPPGFAAQNGNSQDATFSGGVPVYQELFRASSVTSTWQTPVQITAVAFRVADGITTPFNATVPNVEIRLSTTQVNPEQMSTLYASNRGADETTVFLHSNVSLFGRAGAGVNPFDLKFTFDRPFIYDPSKGNLLLYLTHSGSAPGERSLDAQMFGDPNPTSPLASFGGGSFTVPTAYGLIVQFDSVSVPEPSIKSLGILAFGVAIRTAWTWRRIGSFPSPTVKRLSS